MEENNIINNDNLPMDDDGQMRLFEVPAATDRIIKANALIQRMGNTTLLGEKLLLLALSNIVERNFKDYINPYLKKIKENNGGDYSNGLVAEISLATVKQYLPISKKPGGRFYDDLDQLMNHGRLVTSWVIMYEDKDRISNVALITSALFDRKLGKLFIKFNSDAKDLVLRPKAYTELSKSIMFDFKNIEAFSCYQLLKSKITMLEWIQKNKKLPPLKEYSIEFELSELKFLTRTISIDMEDNSKRGIDVRRAIEERDFEAAEQIVKDKRKRKERWQMFKTDVLERASKEINGFKCPFKEDDESLEQYYNDCLNNHPTDIHFRCTLNTVGRGGKVIGVKFYISWDKKKRKNQEEEQVIPSAEVLERESAEDDFMDEMRAELASLPFEFKTKDLRSIAEKAQWDKDKVKKAMDLLKEQNHDNISSPVGWMISAIEKGYESTKKKENAPSMSRSAKAYNSYEQREYSKQDYDDIEQMLLQRTYDKVHEESSDNDGQE